MNYNLSDEDMRKNGYFSRHWYSNFDDFVLKWHYKIIDSSSTVFQVHKLNRIGAESRLLVMVCNIIDGHKRKEIMMYIDGEEEKIRGILFTKKKLTVVAAFEKFKKWCEDASQDWMLEAEKKLALLFQSELRAPVIEKESEIGGEISTKKIGIEGKHKSKKKLK